MYNVRIEKHNIEIRKLKLEVAHQRYHHMKRWTTTRESTIGQSVVPRGSTKNEKQEPVLEKANQGRKNSGKGTKRKKPAGVTSAASRKGKGQSNKTTDPLLAGPLKSPPAKGQIVGGNESPKIQQERHQNESSEQQAPQNQPSEAGENDNLAGQALILPSTEDAPDSNHASKTSRKLLDNDEDHHQPSLVNGHASTAGSATKTLPAAGFQPTDATKPFYVDKVRLVDFDETEAGPSVSRDEQSPLDEHDNFARMSELEEVVSLTKSNSSIDGLSIGLSISDSESFSKISVDSSDTAGDEAAAKLGVDESDEVVIHHDPIPERSNADHNNQTENPQPPLNQHDSSNQPKQSVDSTNEGNQEINDARTGVEFHTSKLDRLKNWLQKALPIGIRKDKKFRGTPRKFPSE